MLVPDNLKAAVVKTDRYEPSLNRVLEDMANHYGTVVVPARPVRPGTSPTWRAMSGSYTCASSRSSATRPSIPSTS